MTELQPILGESDKIRGMVKRLRRSDPVRIAVEAVLDDTEVPEAAFVELMTALIKPKRMRWRRTLLSCWALGFVSESVEQKQAASVRIASILAARPTRKVGCLVAAGCLVSYLGILYIAYTSLVDSPINRIREAAAIALGRLKVTDSVSDLCEALNQPSGTVSSGDKSVRAAAAWSLNNILPGLVDTGYGQIPASTLAAACKLLSNTNEGIASRALAIIKMSGGGSTISAVERFEKKTKNRVNKAAASETLILLRERQDRELAPQRLLTPSQLQEAEAQTLLRSVIESETIESNLLRPTEDGDHIQQNLGNSE